MFWRVSRITSADANNTNIPLDYRFGGSLLFVWLIFEGNYIRDKEFTNWINVRDNDNHGIVNFHEDYDLLYTSPHSWNYWAD